MLIRDPDPLALAAYLQSRLPEIRAAATLAKRDLLPAAAWTGAPRCAPDKLGPERRMAKGMALDEDFVVAEAKLDVEPLPDGAVAAMRLRCGGRTETTLFVDGQPRTVLLSWGTEAWLGDLPPGPRAFTLHLERDKGDGAWRSAETARWEEWSYLVLHRATLDLAAGLEVALQAYRALDPNLPGRGDLHRALREVYAALPAHDPAALRAAAPGLVRALEAKAFGHRDALGVTMGLFGHGHIDLAWLWSVGKTRRKAFRTTLNQLAHARAFPSLVFHQGQAPLYAWLREDYPETFARAREAIGRGNLAATNAMWLEADTNITGLESLIRQVLLGKRFFRELSGADCRVLWLPDCFGFTRALPQILAGAGIDLLITTKISWNQHTRFPHDTFRWFGPDGSEVLAHFVTVPDPGGRFHTYNGAARADEVLGTWTEYAQKDANRILCATYGHGDGGGGPTEEMLLRVGWLKKGLPGFPKVEDFALEEFGRRLQAETPRDGLPTWHDELYLELHRGTFTSQAKLKARNLDLEYRLEALEKLAILRGADLPEAGELWRDHLLVHFHDILPGTGIREVYADMEAHQDRLEARIDAALARISGTAPGKGGPLFNPHGWAYSGPLGFGLDIRWAGEMPPLAVVPAPGPEVTRRVPEPVGYAWENAWVRMAVDPASGALLSLYDKLAAREVLAGPANLLEAYEDRAIVRGKEAWSLEAMHQLKPLARGLRVREAEWREGPGRRHVALCGDLLSSQVVMVITLFDASPAVYVDLEVDWREREVALKAAATLDIAGDRATYGIQGAAISRPRHRDRLEDQARFEVPAQGWMDLSEGGYGVALLAAGKYGFSCDGATARVTLLRSPSSPDQDADKGLHRIRYAYLPHAGDWREAHIPRAAWQFARPPLELPAGSGEIPPTFMVEAAGGGPAANFLWTTCKRAEDGRGLILRGHEAEGRRGRLRVAPPRPGSWRAWRCDLMEGRGRPLDVAEGKLEVEYRPFEIVGLRLEPAG